MADELNAEEDPSDENESCFSFYLHRFKHSFKLRDVGPCYFSLVNNAMLFSCTDNSLKLVNCGLHAEQPIEICNELVRFSVKETYERNDSSIKVCCTRENNKILSIYELVLKQNFERKLIAEANLGTFFEDEKNLDLEVLDAQILLSGENLSVSVLSKSTVITVGLKDDSLIVLSRITIPVFPDSLMCMVDVVQDVYVTWNLITENKLTFYCPEDGQKILEIDLSHYYMDTSNFQIFKLSKDLCTLVLVYQTGDILVIDLVNYCAKNPHCLKLYRSHKLQREQSLFSYLDTYHYGDSSWRQKLLCLHSSKGKESSSRNHISLQSTSTEKAQKLFKSGHKSKVTGFSQRDSKRSSLAPDSKRSSLASVAYPVIKAPPGLHGYSVDDLHVELRTISLVYMYNDKQVLCQWHRDKGYWTTFSLGTGEQVILSLYPGIPHMVLTETSLLCVVTDPKIDQEDFVSQLMAYGGAPVAESVCHLNKWGRCSIPLHTLEVGLKHRQLDTVTFFLKSKENMFTISPKPPDSPMSVIESPLWASSQSHYDNLLQLEPAVNLLLQSVRESLKDKYAQVFGKQVLDTTMDFLYSLLLDGLHAAESTATESSDKAEIQQATDKLLQYIEDARSCVRLLEEKEASSSSRPTSVSAESRSSVSVASTSETDETDGPASQWDTMDPETVVEDGIMQNKILELQQYYLQRGELSRAEYSSIQSIGTKAAISYINHGQMKKARELISKLGLNEVEKLWEVALYTSDTTLCTSITEELLNSSALSNEKVAMVNFLKELNQLYPCRNFEKLKNMHPHVKDCETRDVHRLKALASPTPVFDLIGECGNLSEQPETELQETTQYNEVLLQWVGEWDQNTRDMIKLDVMLNSPALEDSVVHTTGRRASLKDSVSHIGPAGGTDAGYNVSNFSKDVIWEYLLLNNMASLAIDWIEFSYTDNKDTWIGEQLGEIPADFVNHLSQCSSHVRNKILKAFASCGIYSDETLSSFEAILCQVNTVGGILKLPHPLSKCTPAIQEQFHADMIQYCVQHDLPYFLWIYCSLHGVVPQLLQAFSEGELDGSWLVLFQQFYNVTTGNGNYKDLVYQSSMANAMCVWNKDTSSVGELLQGGHTLAALASLMYSPLGLQQVTFVTQQMESFDGMSSEAVEQAIYNYPKLHGALFPASASEAPQTDVSVYQLLVGNAPFDPRRLFGWQSTNTIAGEDAMDKMPYFSDSQLVSSCGYSEQLKYTYYLKQGRPSFAFVTFLAEEFKNGGPTISSKRLTTALGTSLWYGVKHFNQASICSSCVTFQELLGHDSLLLRTYIQVGHEILLHRNNAVTGTMEKRREQIKKNEEDIVSLLLDCVQSSGRCAASVQQALEAAILAGITRNMVSMESFESGQRWTVAVLFCSLMRLPYTTVFLEACAQSNQWLPFIWFSQLHQYPKEQLLNLLHYFKSVHLQEHLRYILANADMWSASENRKQDLARKRSDMAAKDVRSRMLQRIGVVKEQESDETSSSENEDAHLTGVQPQDSPDQDIDVQVSYEGAPGDVFGVMFAAQTTSCPWKSLLAYAVVLRNSLFSELAACYEGAGTLCCLCAWLVAMMDSTEHEQFIEHHGKSPWRYNLQTLDALLDIYVKQKWGSVLVTGFDIFQNESPLLPFLQFYADFTEKKSYNNSLDVFKEAVFQLHHNSSIKSSMMIGSSQWLERTTFRIIQHMLTSTPSIYEVTQLLKILDAESITLIFKDVDADFKKQYQLLQCIQTSGVQEVNLVSLLCQSGDGYQQECTNIVQKLIKQHMFNEARKFAELAGVKNVQVTMQQLLQQKSEICSTGLWSSRNARLNFYRDCMDKCRKHQVPSKHLINFLKGEAAITDCPAERADLYQMCMQAAMEDQGQDENTQNVISELYRQMWTNRIQNKLQATEEAAMGGLTGGDVFADVWLTAQQKQVPVKKELLCFGKMPQKGDKPTDLSHKEINALESLMGELLQGGEINECCRVACEFGMYCQDLAIILTCIRLSLGSINLEHFTADMLHLLRTQSGQAHRQSIAAPVALLRNSSSISLISNIQPLVDSVTEENEEKISAMERLLNHCDAGKPTCVRILTAFKISTVLGIGYEDVITDDDYNILRSLLKTDCMAKFRLASDFLGTSALSPEEVAGFLSDAILHSYKASLGDITGSQEMLFDPGKNMADFHQIVRLCREPSLLGSRLLDATAAMATTEEQMSSTVLTLQTELLILAHECYTASCDMEGISNILRAARILTIHLASNTEYQLMTRLLTGVGRFNEMTYIFDALQESHQFEMLLGKGMEKESKLKTAILDYLKRYHPSDTDTYTMVALNFMMYREIAQLLEDNAKRLLKKFERKHLDNNNDTQSSLQKITQFYTEAAESYIKDECLRHAQSCIRQARLVALQIKYLPSNKRFINLTTKGANLLISDHPVFTEAFIISEAYQRKDNWATALYNNVICCGDSKYLQEFRSHIRVTTQLIEDAIDKYRQSSEKSPQSLNNIKKLLQLCKDVKVQYKLASELGLRDIVINLEKGDAKSYIRDIASSVS